MKISIRWKLILSIGVPLFIVLLLLLILNFKKLEQKAHEQLGTFVTTLVSKHAEKMDGQFETIASVAKLTATFLHINPDLTPDELGAWLVTNMSYHPLIHGSGIAFEPYAYAPDVEYLAPFIFRNEEAQDGEEDMHMIDFGAENIGYRNWSWYGKAKAFKEPAWSTPYRDEQIGDLMVMTYAVPFSEGTKFRGVTTVHVHLESLRRWVRESELEGVEFVILSQDGKFVFHPDPDLIMRESVFEIAENMGHDHLGELAQMMLSGENGMDRLENFPAEGETSFIVFAPIPSTGWVFAAVVPEGELVGGIVDELGKQILLMIAAIILILIIILIGASRITAPIRRLVKEFQKVATGDLDVDHKQKFPEDEIGLLASTFYRMVGAIKLYIKKLAEEIKNRESVEGELRVARDIQSSLLPQTFPPFPERTEFDLHATNVPARHVAGDFYDFFFVSETKLAVVIADVSGKGVPAAMFMAVSRTLLRNFSKEGESPAKILEQVNRSLAQDNSQGLFVTLILIFYDIATGKVEYANAGHPPPLIVNGEGHVRSFGKTTGSVMGAFQGVTFEDAQESIATGETLVFFTDGVPEARNINGTFYGMDRFEEALSNQAGKPVTSMCDALFRSVTDFQGEDLSDDITLMLLKNSGK